MRPIRDPPTVQIQTLTSTLACVATSFSSCRIGRAQSPHTFGTHAEFSACVPPMKVHSGSSIFGCMRIFPSANILRSMWNTVYATPSRCIASLGWRSSSSCASLRSSIAPGDWIPSALERRFAFCLRLGCLLPCNGSQLGSRGVSLTVPKQVAWIRPSSCQSPFKVQSVVKAWTQEGLLRVLSMTFIVITTLKCLSSVSSRPYCS
mmetsp:Transcript_93856/g.303750  ORF Transcript_93856/g.303750 Transcript_93856/m.303750 type:complete len:205 (-) Transcript_93856:834-1448(-)